MRKCMVFLYVVGLMLVNCCVIGKYLKEPDPADQKFLRDEYGRILILHGVNVSNFSKHSGEPSGYFNRNKGDTCWQRPEDFTRARNWGFNAVRHIWSWETLEPTQGTFNDYYIDRKLKRIRWMATESLYVIVDLHQDIYAQKFCGNGFPEWMIRDEGKEFGGCRDPWNLAYLDTAVLTTWDNFWNNDTLQDKYIEMIDHVFSLVDTIPNVLGIDVMNEPFPDMSGKFERKKLTRLYKRIYEMRKEKGYKKLIFFEPWMSTSAGIGTCLREFGDEGIIYFPHYYDMAIDAKKPYGTANKLYMDRAVPAKVYEAEYFGAPIFFGEFGVTSATEGYMNYLKDLLNVFDKYRCGWFYWSYDLLRYNDYSFIDNDKQPLPKLGLLSRVYPQKIAGDDPTYKINGNKFTLFYTKINIDQPTVIFIPEGLDITVRTDGEYEQQGRCLLYTNTGEEFQSITITW